MELLEEIAGTTNSEMVLVLIVLCILWATAINPMVKKFNEEKASQRKHQDEREDKIIEVISQNTKVVAQFTVLCEQVSTQNKNGFLRVHDRLDSIAEEIKVIPRAAVKV